MFKSTKAFKNNVTNHPKEPTLRIGRYVPENAVNLAYYYNPTATDAEKILTAEAPRNTIDHRVEESYKYLFNQASDDDNLFPGSVFYEDEEGYQGHLGRMYVNWYPEAHIETKNIQEVKDVIVTEKSEVPKMYEYSDANGYIGNLYLDATSYEVTKTKKINTTEVLDREILNHELNYHEIFGNYISPNSLDEWMKEPTADTSTMWPNRIIVELDKLHTESCNNRVKNFINLCTNPYDDATGILAFTSLQYEQVYTGLPENSTINNYSISNVFSTKNDKKPIRKL